MSAEVSSGSGYILMAVIAVVILGIGFVYAALQWQKRRKVGEVGQASVAGPAAKHVPDEPLHRSPPIANANVQAQSQSQGPH